MTDADPSRPAEHPGTATVTIRPRTPEDLPGCVTVLAAVHKDSRYPVAWPDDPERWLTPRAIVSAWVATRNGAVVGHVVLTDEPVSGGGRRGAIGRLFVDPAERRTGIGGRLLRQAQAGAHERGLPVELDVADNGAAAISLYRRLGWRVVGREPISWGGSDATHVLIFRPPED